MSIATNTGKSLVEDLIEDIVPESVMCRAIEGYGKWSQHVGPARHTAFGVVTKATAKLPMRRVKPSRSADGISCHNALKWMNTRCNRAGSPKGSSGFPLWKSGSASGRRHERRADESIGAG